MFINSLRASKKIVEVITDRTIASPQSLTKVGFINAGGGGNLGDEIMVEAAQRLYPELKFCRLVRPNWEKILKGVGLSAKPYFKSVIIGGGTLINMGGRRIEMVQNSLQQGLPLWTLGTGVGSSGLGQPNQVEIKAWKPLLADFKHIGVRGPRSQQSLESLGVKNVEVIGDMALNFARSSCMTPAEQPKFALNLRHIDRNHYDYGENKKLQEIEETARQLVADGWLPLPIAMDRSDIYPLKKMMYDLSLDYLPISLISSADEFFEIVQTCHFTLGVRLHSVVLSCCAGVPPLMLGYRDKCLDFMQSMDLEDWYVNLQTAESGEILEKTLMLSRNAHQLRSPILFKAQEWKLKIEQYVIKTLLGSCGR